MSDATAEADILDYSVDDPPERITGGSRRPRYPEITEALRVANEGQWWSVLIGPRGDPDTSGRIANRIKNTVYVYAARKKFLVRIQLEEQRDGTTKIRFCRLPPPRPRLHLTREHDEAG